MKSIHVSGQRGAALFVSLIFLLVLTVLGVASMNDTVVQSRMSAAFQDSNYALQSVETALRDAEDLIDSFDTVFLFQQNGNGLYSAGNAPDPFDPATWTGTVTRESRVSVDGIPQTPRYFIEQIGLVSGQPSRVLNNQNSATTNSASSVTGFRIVARSVGPSGVSQRMLESFYGSAF